ncbi:Nodule Cysteine-Rich (NCR) secreted peptide [Medicago truncatula]|uniref:Nodule Cysteine-Rich (NCR) secreted peptide n=1 Tax=Medicago truncatula TaxID=3880 RepID=G7IDP5_MEDTR|nr:Nodule Cysteine-Rich (NCR) secreted peptide [Medicago truncatula]
MTQILLFVYFFIIFLSLSFVVTSYRTRIPCVSDYDCPKASYPLFIKCIYNFCEIWGSPTWDATN